MDELFEQMQIQIDAAPKDGNNGSAVDAFGCCSRYRDCSEIGTCLIPHLGYSERCIYRQSLEAGHIF